MLKIDFVSKFKDGPHRTIRRPVPEPPVRRILSLETAMFRLAALVWVVVGTSLAGSLLLLVLTIPFLTEQGRALIPYAVAAGFGLAVPAAALIARRIVGTGARAA